MSLAELASVRATTAADCLADEVGDGYCDFENNNEVRNEILRRHTYHIRFGGGYVQKPCRSSVICHRSVGGMNLWDLVLFGHHKRRRSQRYPRWVDYDDTSSQPSCEPPPLDK